MHSLLSIAPTKSKAWDQARYTPVFMGHFPVSLWRTCTVLYSYFRHICIRYASYFYPVVQAKEKINTESFPWQTKQRRQDHYLCAIHLERCLAQTAMAFNIAFSASPLPVFLAILKYFHKWKSGTVSPAPSFPWMRSVRLPWGRGAGGGSILLGGRRGGVWHL